MIEPKELRIGNWVNYEGKPVRAICVGTSLSTFEHKGDEKSFHVLSLKKNLYSPDSGEYSPIELTSAILQKAGFAKYTLAGYGNHYEYSKTIGVEVIRITALFGCDFSICLHRAARRITSLHDLQNKIFAVTGKELEIEFFEQQQQ